MATLRLKVLQTLSLHLSWVGDGVIDIDGVAYVPLDARELGSGNIKKLGGAAETVGFSEVSTDLFRVRGEAVIGITAVTVNEGNLFGISGAAELQHSIHQKKLHFSSLLDLQNHLFLVYSEFSSGTLFSFAGGDERNALLGKAVVVSNYSQENQRLTNFQNLQHLRWKIINCVLHTSILEIQVSTLLILNLVVHNSSETSVWKSHTRNTQRYTV